MEWRWICPLPLFPDAPATAAVAAAAATAATTVAAAAVVPLTARFPPQCGGCRGCWSTAVSTTKGGRRTRTPSLLWWVPQCRRVDGAGNLTSFHLAKNENSWREFSEASSSKASIPRERVIPLTQLLHFFPSLGNAIRASQDEWTRTISRFYYTRTGVRAIWHASRMGIKLSNICSRLTRAKRLCGFTHCVSQKQSTAFTSRRMRMCMLRLMLIHGIDRKWSHLSPHTFNFEFQLFRTVFDIMSQIMTFDLKTRIICARKPCKRIQSY